MFDKRHFPYQYECDGCGALETVQHEDVQNVTTYFTTPPKQAVEYVMANRRGWSLETGQDSLCPDCINARH